MQSVSSRIWTRVAVFISYDDNDYNTGTWKLMMMHKALHPRDDIVRLYVSTKEGRRGLANIEDCVDALIGGLEANIKKKKLKKDL